MPPLYQPKAIVSVCLLRYGVRLMSAAQGSQAKFGVGTTSTVDQAYDFKSESITCAKISTIRMGLSEAGRHLRAVRTNIRHIGGPVTLEPNSIELANLLPWILGANASGTTFALSDTLPSRYVSIDRITKVFTYSGCVVNRATFSASEGGPLVVNLDLVGVDETVNNAGTFPSLTISTAVGPYMLSDLACTVGGTTYNFREFSITIDNMLETGFRLVDGDIDHSTGPHDVGHAAWTVCGSIGSLRAVSGRCGGGGDIHQFDAIDGVYDGGAVPEAFSYGAWQVGDLPAVAVGIARKSGTASLTVTNDSTSVI